MQRVGGWTHCLSPFITDPWIANYPSNISIGQFWIPSHCSATESRQYETLKQDDERSVTYIPVPIMDGPDQRYCIFRYSSLNSLTIGVTKSKSTRSLLFMFIIMVSESISTFPGTQNFRIWNTNLFCLTGWSEAG